MDYSAIQRVSGPLDAVRGLQEWSLAAAGILSVLLVWAGYYVLGLITRVDVRRLRERFDAALEQALAEDSSSVVVLRNDVNYMRDKLRLLWIVASVLLAFCLVLFTFARTLGELLEAGGHIREVGMLGVGFGFGAWVRAMLAERDVASMASGLEAVLHTRTRLVQSVKEGDITSLAIAEQVRAARESERFQQNLGLPFEIKQLELHEAGIFGAVSWNFEPQVNVLLGRNGYGKSFLLRVMVAMLTNDASRLAVLVPPGTPEQARMLLTLVRGDDTLMVERDGPALSSECGKVSVLAIPDSRFINRAKGSVTAEGDDFTDLARFGAHHFLNDLSYSTSLHTVLAQLCIDVLAGSNGSFDNPRTPQLDLVSRVMTELTGETFRFCRIEPVGAASFRILVESGASPGRPIPIQHASQGTLSMVSICALIFQFLRRTHPAVPSWEVAQQSGIVIIDEVDAHLHPAWQRKIVHLLRKTFPQAQFILTAHSPLVVAGCGPGEISVLRREEGRGLRVVEYQRDFIGVSAEDIYKEVFQIEQYDEAFLDYQSKLPAAPQMRAELAQLQASGASGQPKAMELETMLAAMDRTQAESAHRIALEALELENQQLRRQLDELRVPAEER